MTNPSSDSAKTPQTIRQALNESMTQAIASKDPVSTATLRLILATIQDRDSARLAAFGETTQILSELEIRHILQDMVLQRQQAAQNYEQDGRLEQAERENHEAQIIQNFLPIPLQKAQIETALQDAIRAVKATSLKDKGAVMRYLRQHYTGQLDFQKISKHLQGILQKR